MTRINMDNLYGHLPPTEIGLVRPTAGFTEGLQQLAPWNISPASHYARRAASEAPNWFGVAGGVGLALLGSPETFNAVAERKGNGLLAHVVEIGSEVQRQIFSKATLQTTNRQDEVYRGHKDVKMTNASGEPYTAARQDLLKGVSTGLVLAMEGAHNAAHGPLSNEADRDAYLRDAGYVTGAAFGVRRPISNRGTLYDSVDKLLQDINDSDPAGLAARAAAVGGVLADFGGRLGLTLEEVAVPVLGSLRHVGRDGATVPLDEIAAGVFKVNYDPATYDAYAAISQERHAQYPHTMSSVASLAIRQYRADGGSF